MNSVRPDAALRPVYRHSVIRGGAWSAGELDAKLAADPVAAAHYGDFQRGMTRIDRLERGLSAYVSYRIADSVYWTREPVSIPSGEEVLSDGTNLARARCGNRISLKPREPIGPDVLPDELEENPGDNYVPGEVDVRNLPVARNILPPFFGENFSEAAQRSVNVPPSPIGGSGGGGAGSGGGTGGALGAAIPGPNGLAPWSTTSNTAPADLAELYPPAGFLGFLAGFDLPTLYEWTGTDSLWTRVPTFSGSLPGLSSPNTPTGRGELAAADPSGPFRPTLSGVFPFGGSITPPAKGGSGSDPGKRGPGGSESPSESFLSDDDPGGDDPAGRPGLTPQTPITGDPDLAAVPEPLSAMLFVSAAVLLGGIGWLKRGVPPQKVG